MPAFLPASISIEIRRVKNGKKRVCPEMGVSQFRRAVHPRSRHRFCSRGKNFVRRLPCVFVCACLLSTGTWKRASVLLLLCTINRRSAALPRGELSSSMPRPTLCSKGKGREKRRQIILADVSFVPLKREGRLDWMGNPTSS